MDNTNTLQEKARIFLRNDLRVFIQDTYNNYHFCLIKEVWNDWVIVYDFKGNYMGKTTRILWLDIQKMEEYQEKEK